MGSYAAFYLAGMYPVPATRQILLSSPYFPEISFYNPTFGKTTTIKARGFQGNPANGEGGSVFVKVTIGIYPVLPIFSNITGRAECHYRRKVLEVELLSRVGRLRTGIHGRVGADGRYHCAVRRNGGCFTPIAFYRGV